MKTTTLLLFALAGAASAIDPDHAAWDRIVSERVEGERFDYAGLKRERAPLDAYLDRLAAVTRDEYDGWSDGDRLAFLINLYNAATVALVLDHHPLESIREIGGERGPWKLPVVRVFGGKVTLDRLEHEMIRKWFAEPRIHFAVNCASIGCPPLRDEAYTGRKLERQLAEQTRAFLTDRDVNRLEGGVLRLSPLFDWFEDDFARAAGSVRKYVAPHFPERERAKILGGEVEIRYGDYDWSLNDT